MAVFTKPVSEKNINKVDVNLKSAEYFSPQDAGAEGGYDEPHYVLLRSRARRASSLTMACLLLIAFLVMSSILGGCYLYNQLAHSKMDRMKGWCRIHKPDNKLCDRLLYDERDDQSATYKYGKFDLEWPKLCSPRVNQFMSEELDIGRDSGNEHILTFNSEARRSSRFIHDFRANKTGIVDEEARRCFVMPLNRTQVLPPRKLIDLFYDLWFYETDIETVRKTMHVLLPPIKDRQSVGMYIERDCAGYPIYQLEKVVSGAYNRSVAAELFITHFSRKYMELYIDNMDQVKDYEREHNQDL